MEAPAIPVRNLFHLLVYAWDHHLDEADEQEFGADQCPDLAHLLARILTKGVHELLRGGLDRDYVPHEETTPRIRGRIDFTTSARHQTWTKGMLHCEYDELSHDVLHNRILKSTLGIFSRDPSLAAGLRNGIDRCLGYFRDVQTSLQVHPADFRKVQLHRNNRSYRFLLSLCELIHASLLPDRSTPGKRRFRDFTRNETVMARIFENFVLNFSKRHFPEAKTRAMTLEWQAEGSSEAKALLPQMRTDVTMVFPDRRVILDCKYYADALSKSYREGPEVRKFRSAHLYQLHAYLTNAARHSASWKSAEGVLLYPVAGSRLDQQIVLFDQHPLRIVTLDLEQLWPEIERQLYAILEGQPLPYSITSQTV